jgi:hypothetical protein
MILSVRQNTPRFLTMVSVFTLVSPQHETDNHAKRECGGERRDRTVRYEFLDVIFLLTQGLAELIQPGLDLIGRASARVFEASKISSPVVFSRRDTSPFSACNSSLSSLELNIGFAFGCIIQPEFYASPRQFH